MCHFQVKNIRFRELNSSQNHMTLKKCKWNLNACFIIPSSFAFNLIYNYPKYFLCPPNLTTFHKDWILYISYKISSNFSKFCSLFLILFYESVHILSHLPFVKCEAFILFPVLGTVYQLSEVQYISILWSFLNNWKCLISSQCIAIYWLPTSVKS